MPKIYRKRILRKTRKSTRRFRRYRRKIGKGTYKASVQKAIGFSRSQFVKFRYVQQVTLSPASTNFAYIVYSANGLYQPNIGASASTGFSSSHQPISFDQWSPIYNEYTVLGSRIRISASPPNSTSPAAGGGVISCMLSDTATPITVPTTVFESGRASFRQFNPNTSQSPCIVKKNFSAKKFWRLQSVKDNQKAIGALFTANPSEQAYYHVAFFTNDTSTASTLGPFCWITIDYIAMLTGPQDLSAS